MAGARAAPGKTAPNAPAAGTKKNHTAAGSNATHDTTEAAQIHRAGRALEPVSRVFGFDRGTCIDRYYIERFLDRHAKDVRGRVLEVADREYTTRFGGSRVTHSDVLHMDPSHRKATIVADLTDPHAMDPARFDCVILTQTLQHIFHVEAAVRTVHRILKPGGVVLASVPGISQISRYDMDRWGDYWRFTTRAAACLFEPVFGKEHVAIESFGNVLIAAAFLHGLAAEEFNESELMHGDPDYQLVITIRARKMGRGGS